MGNYGSPSPYSVSWRWLWRVTRDAGRRLAGRRSGVSYLCLPVPSPPWDSGYTSPAGLSPPKEMSNEETGILPSTEDM